MARETDAYLNSVGLPQVKASSDEMAYRCLGCLKKGKPTRWQGQVYYPNDLKTLSHAVKAPKPKLHPRHKSMMSMLHGASRHHERSPVADSILHHLRSKGSLDG